MTAPPEIEIDAPSVRVDGDDRQAVSAWQALMKPPDKFGGIRSAAKARQADQIRRAEKNFQITQKVDEAMRARKTYSEIRDLVRRSGAVCKVHKKVTIEGAVCDDDEERDINLSYRNQANLDMYTSVNMKQREENKHHPEVVKAIQDFWDSLPKTTNGNINKSIYKWFNRKLFFTLVPKSTEDEFERTVHEDWKNDAVYSNVMNWRMFRNAIFALADLWCETVDPSEYRDFLVRCRKICEAPPAYGGRRDEEADRGDGGRRRTVAPQREVASHGAGNLGGGAGGVKLRRKSSLPNYDSPSQSPSDQPLEPMTDEYSALKVADEQLEDEISDHQILMFYSALQELSDIDAQETEETDDAVHQQLRELQDIRFDLFEDDKDPSFALEAQLMNEARQDMERRMERNTTMSEERNKLQKKTSKRLMSDLAAWRNVRAQKQNELRETQEKFFNDIRDSMQSAVVRNRNAHQAIGKLDKDRVQRQKAALPSAKSALACYYDNHLKEIDRSLDAQCDQEDDQFTEFVLLTSDIQQLRALVEKAAADHLMTAVHEEFFTSEDPDMNDVKELKFGNSRFKRAVEWLRRHQDRRNDFMEDVTQAAMDAIKKLKHNETKYLHRLHRQEMDLETQTIEAYAADDLMPSKMKIPVMERLQEAKKNANALRSKQTEEMQKRHAVWDEQLDALLAANVERDDIEKKFLTQVATQKSIEEAFAQAKPVIEKFNEALQQGIDPLEATTAAGARPPQLDATDVELPKDVESPLDFIGFIMDRANHFFGVWLVSFAALRHNIFFEKSTKFFELERHQKTSMRIYYKQALARRVDLVDYLGEVLLNPELSKDYSEQQLHDVSEAVHHGKSLKKLAAEIEENHEFFLESTDRIANLQKQRAAERKARFNKCYLVETGELKRFGELATAKSEHQLQILLRYGENWSEVERAVRIAEMQARDRRQREQEKIQREQKAAEDRRKAAEEARLERLAQDERDRIALEEARRRREKQANEARRRQLEERERKAKERERQQQEQKRKWREEFTKEEEQRKKESDERRALERRRVAGKPEKGEKMSTPPPQPELQSKKSDAKPRLARRQTEPKKPEYNPNVPVAAQKALLADKKVKAVRAPSTRIKEAIENEIKSFATLNTTSMAVHLESFADRRQDYFLERASNAAIYAMECTRLRCPIVPAISTMLSNEELDFYMMVFDVSGKSCNVMSLLDIIMLTPIGKLGLRNIKGLDKDVAKKLCQSLATHAFIQVIDIGGNPDIGEHGGQSLLSLVKANKRIAKIVADGCNITPTTLREIEELIKKHNFSHTIGRAEFNYVLTVFRDIDKDGSGAVDLSELREYNKRHQQLLGTKSHVFEASASMSGGPESPTNDPSNKTLSFMHERQTNRVDQVRDVLLQLDRDGAGSFTLVDLLCYIYTTWEREDIERLVSQYTDDSNGGATLTEMQQFIDQFGSNGTLTLHQLAKGLGEADVESLRGAFQECDLDGDGFLSIDEFMTFVGA